MPVDLLLASASTFSFAAIALGVALLVLNRRYQRHFMLLWAWGWIAGGLASVGTALLVSPAARAPGSPVGRVAGTVLVAGVLLQGVLQWRGARAFRGARARGDGVSLPVLLIGVVAVAGMAEWATDSSGAGVRLVARVALPYGLLGAAFLYSAVVVRLRGQRQGVGFQLLPLALAAYGLQKAVGALVGGGVVDLPGDVVSMFTDLLSLCLVAFALPAWFLEEEWAQLSRSEARQRQLEEELYQAQKLKALGEMAAGVAHDFNNLLTVIGGHTELLAEESEGPTAEGLKEIAQAQERGSNLVKRLLAFARHQELTTERVDPAEVLRDVIRLLGPLVGDAIVTVGRCESDPFAIDVDRSQLEQALVNLGANARDAMPRGGRMEVVLGGREAAEAFEIHGTTVPAGRWTYFCVTDSGVGMSDEVRERAFEPFFTTKTRERGTGLGLATVFGFVQQSQGHVAVESEEGRGSRFTLFLPAAR